MSKNIIFYFFEKNNYLNRCTCGHHFKTNKMPKECPKCKAKTIKNLSICNKEYRNIYYKVLDEGPWGFVVEKITDIIDTETCEFIKKYTNKIIFDFRTNTFKIKNKTKDSEITDASVNRFFSIGRYNFINMLKNEKLKVLIEFSSRVLTQDKWCYTKSGFGLERLKLFPIFQVACNMGASKDFLESIVDIFKKNIDELQKYTKVNELLELPKYLIKMILDCPFDADTIDTLRKIDKKYGQNKVISFFDIIQQRNKISQKTFMIVRISEFYEIILKYHYDFLKLTKYIFIDIKKEQGIVSADQGLVLLRDYLKMQDELKSKIDKYPKSLKKAHDVALMHYIENKDKILSEKFTKVVQKEEYLKNKYSNQKYSIIVPKDNIDLIREGNELSHCVSSYVDSVIQGRSKIYFLRDNNDLSKSLVTIEVDNYNRIIQHRGRFNRNINPDEKDFIVEWASKKELIYNY